MAFDFSNWIPVNLTTYSTLNYIFIYLSLFFLPILNFFTSKNKKKKSETPLLYIEALNLWVLKIKISSLFIWIQPMVGVEGQSNRWLSNITINAWDYFYRTNLSNEKIAKLVVESMLLKSDRIDRFNLFNRKPIIFSVRFWLFGFL